MFAVTRLSVAKANSSLNTSCCERPVASEGAAHAQCRAQMKSPGRRANVAGAKSGPGCKRRLLEIGLAYAT